jgi:hypothetical protein
MITPLQLLVFHLARFMAGAKLMLLSLVFPRSWIVSGAVSIYASSVFTIVGASSNSDVSVVVVADQATSDVAPTIVSEITFLCDAPYEAAAHKFIICCPSGVGAMVNSQIASALKLPFPYEIPNCRGPLWLDVTMNRELAFQFTSSGYVLGACILCKLRN